MLDTMTMSMDYALATITGTKTLTGGNLEAGEFRFGLYDSNGTLIDTKTNDASGNITFRTIPYYTAGTYSYTVKEINEQGENNVSDIEYDPSVYTVTVNVDENMDMSITCIKNGTNVDNSSESVDGISFENKMSVTAAAIDPAVKKVLNNAELQPGEFTFQLFDENNNLIDTKKKTDNGSLSKNITFWGMKSLPGYDDPIDVTITTTTTTSVGQATGNTTTNTETKTTKAKSMREVFQGKENSLFGSGAIKGPINAIGSVLTLMIPWMISYLAVALSYLISISNAILLIAYGFCMPLALAQCFEEGQRSAGIRYLKKFAAQALTFMVIIIILFAVSKLQGAILPQLLKGLCKNGTLDINNDNFRQVIGNWRVLISIVVVQFAAVGAMLKGAQIANDIVGV